MVRVITRDELYEALLKRSKKVIAEKDRQYLLIIACHMIAFDLFGIVAIVVAERLELYVERKMVSVHTSFVGDK